MAYDYSGVRGSMYTARGLVFTVTQRQETHNICSQKLLFDKGSSLEPSVTWWWSPSHLETATLLTIHSYSYWHLNDVWGLFKWVHTSGGGEREGATETVEKFPLCACVYVHVSRFCWRLSRTSQLFDLLNSEGNLAAPHRAQTLLCSDEVILCF